MEDEVSLRSMGTMCFCLCVFSNISKISTSFFLEGKILQDFYCFIRSFVGFYFDIWVRMRFGDILEGVFDNRSIRMSIYEGFRFRGVRCQVSFGLRGVPIVYEGGGYGVWVRFLGENVGDIYGVGIDLFDSIG